MARRQSPYRATLSYNWWRAPGTAGHGYPWGRHLTACIAFQKRSHSETDTDNRPYVTSKPRPKGAKLRPLEFLCAHPCRIRRARFIADAVRANWRARPVSSQGTLCHPQINQLAESFWSLPHPLLWELQYL